VRQIFPAPATAPEMSPGDSDSHGPPAESALAALYAYPDPAARAAPWVRANMVASADGAASFDERSGGLSGGADRTLFKVLRSLADVIVAGAGTARAERYRPVRDGEVWPRLRQGRTPTPPIAVITRGLSVSADDPLLTKAPEWARTIVLTTQAAPRGRWRPATRSRPPTPSPRWPSAATGAFCSRAARRCSASSPPPASWTSSA
jgi:hypothetical protein